MAQQQTKTEKHKKASKRQQNTQAPFSAHGN
jgi:hypothetical protein